jgi:hypothetical protein
VGSKLSLFQPEAEPHLLSHGGREHPRLHLVETSSPGIKHQSGGPILDVEGTVWGIQTKTRLLDLGVSGQVIDSSGAEIAVPQYLNSGFGADAETVMGFLDHHGISYQTD